MAVRAAWGRQRRSAAASAAHRLRRAPAAAEWHADLDAAIGIDGRGLLLPGERDRDDRREEYKNAGKCE
jgi:hypothetical protein